jgi:hypothetical protein
MLAKHLFLFIVISAVLCWSNFSFAQPNEPRLQHGVDRPGGDFRNFNLQTPNP